MKTIFLSDIHIGIDADTNLYQSSSDQVNLKSILKYVLDSHVKDVVIIGDWIDLWMYGTTVIPPTVQQIIDHNPQIFTRQSDGSGDFVSVLDGIEGTIHYVNGNHDISVTQTDINGYFNTVSQKQVHCIDCSKEPNGYISDSGHIFGEHGHWYSMVCRPYENEPLPFGYYITRAGMQAMLITKAALPPMNLIGMQTLISYQGITFAQAFMTELAGQCGYTNLAELIFTMPDGSQIDANAVANKFPNLSINDMDFLRTDAGGSLDVRARALLHKHKILLFGHTHVKELQQHKEYHDGEYTGSTSVYVNTGFIPANNPVNGIPVSTFVEIDDTNGQGPYVVSIMKVNSGNIAIDKTLTIE